jgi:Family of unknown function (DUF6174)
MRTQLVACCLLASFGQPLMASPQDAEYLAQLEQAERMWSSAVVSGYRYTLVKGGVFGYSEYTVRFKEGRCTARSRFVFDKPRPWQSTKCEGLTMPALFSEVREQLVRGTRRVELNFDESLGHIVKFSAEPDTDLTDQDWYLRVSDFRATFGAPNKTMEPTR